MRAIARGFYPALVLSLAGFNAWWALREARPVPTPEAIASAIARGRSDESDRALREVLRRSPRDGKARTLLAKSLAARGDFLGCARELHRVPDWWPSKREALYLEGEASLKAERARDAEAAWRACIRDDPLHPPRPEHLRAAAEGLIKLFAAQERWGEANEVAWRLYESAGPADRPQALVLRLRTEVERIAPETRSRRLGRFVEADPGDWDSRLGLARAELALGRSAEATRQVLACLEARPDDPEACRTRLEILEGQGDGAALAEAIGHLPASADLDGRIWSCRGQVLMARGDVEGSVAAHRRAEALRPLDEQILYRLAQAERRLGRRERAEALLARSKALREARAGLLGALQAFSRAAPPGRAAGPELADGAARLASLCEALGLAREAEALRSLAPPP